ncbi:MAG: outer membrane protein transport protein [Oleiphilaceae bacterium]|nr:outer membrane protein transport protein [Oleiphilaceae bacterium]
MSLIPRMGHTLVFAAAMGAGAAAQASMGSIATTYGLLYSDVGTAQGLSLFNGRLSATYYNPANLVQGRNGELVAGLLHAEPELRVNQTGGNQNAPQRSGTVLEDDRAQQVVLGLKTDLSDLTIYDHPINFGLMLGVEKFGRELLAFESRKAEEGQFLEYGRQPLFVSAGVGTRLWRGIDAGLATRVTLHADANLEATTTTAGETSDEKLTVGTKPFIRVIAGLTMDMGETFCPDQGCWYDGLTLATAYRTLSNTRTGVNADVDVDGIAGTIPIRINTIDSYQPETYTAGAEYRFGSWRIGATAEFQRWEQLSNELNGNDTIKDDGNVQFRDILIPRLGVEYEFTRLFTVMGGLAYEESPLESTRNPEVNYLDNDRYVVGLGAQYCFCRLPVIAHPVTLGIGYQYQRLTERDFELVNNEGSSDESIEFVTADGEVHVFTGSITMHF